jgi:hypothetical protein
MQKEQVLTIDKNFPIKSPMRMMYEELMTHEYAIPLELIVRCKELIEQENQAMYECWILSTMHFDKISFSEYLKQIYNEDYSTDGGENEQN